MDLGKYKEYNLPVSTEKEKFYRLYLLQPKWYIFKDMLGLVVVSLLMIFLLIISYLYLLRIISQQKTIDEIKSDFVSNMTHELKTPISTVYAAVDALQCYGIGDDPVKRNEYLSISKGQLIRLNNLIEQILTVSIEKQKNIGLKLEEIKVKEVFESLKKQFILKSSKNIEIDVNVSPVDLIVKADRMHFTNIISNLIENAIKYSSNEVKITIAANKNKIVISVMDNGIGMSQGALDKVFDKFYRVPTGNIHNVKGYGLGLFYVKTAVLKHGWIINVSSCPDKGTCFEIIIAWT